MANLSEPRDDLARELAETRERLHQLESAASMQHQAEAALREIEAHYERLLESVNSYVFRVELDQGCAMHTTHGFGCTAITGYTPAEFEENPNLWIDMVPNADRAMVMEQIGRLHSGQDIIPIEHRIRRKDGEIRWVQNTSVPRRDAVGQLLGYDGLIEDITERKRAQEALRNREIIFPPFVENLYDLITIHDSLGWFSYVSPSATRLLGYAAEALIGLSLFEFIHPEDLSTVQAAFQKAVARVTPTLPMEYRYRHADGSWVYLESVASNLQDHFGVNGIVVTTREIPVSRRMARGFIYQDHEGKIVSANAVAEKILGLSLGEMAGRTSSDPRWRAVREDGSELPGDQHPSMVALRTGQPVRDVVMGVFNPSENAYRWIVVYSVPFFLPGETRPFQVYSSFIDITEQKRAQESLRISENRHRSLVSHMAEGVALHKVIYDENGKAIDYEIMDVNPQYERILNLAREKVTHRRGGEAYGTLEPPYLEEFSHVANSGKPYRFETYFAPMARFFDISVVSWEKGQFATIFTDITERKQMEQALRANEERFRSLVHNSYDIITLHDAQGRVTYESPSAARAFGYEPGALIGKDPFTFIHPDDLPAVQGALAQVVKRSHRGIPTEFRFQHKDGSWVHVESVASNLLDNPGINGILITSRDVSAKKAAEKAIQSILRGTSSAVGEAFFRSLVLELAAALQTRCVFVGELLSAEVRRVRTVAFCVDGKIAENVEYDLQNSPCEQVVGRSLGFFPREVCCRFPADPLLAELGAESYLGVPLFTASGVPLGLLAVIHDQPLPESERTRSLCTIFGARAGAELERLQAEKALRESEDNLRKIISLSPIGMAVTNLNGDCEYLNERFVQIFGYTRDDLPSIDQWWSLAYPDPAYRASTRLRWESSVKQAMNAGGEIGPAVRRVSCKDGTVKAIEFRTACIKSRVITLFDDVTESKRAEDALRESERRFRELLENVNLVAVMLDTQGRITFCNDQLLRLTGWDRQEILGHNWFDVFVRGSEGDQIRARFFQSIQASEIPAHYEYPIVTRYGASRLIAWDNTVLREVGGAVVGMAGLGRDITEQRSLEEQLRQAQKMESIGRLAGGVAHDFNNLLTAINGYAELLLLEIRAADPLYSGVRAIKKAGEQATALTRQLLAFSRKQLMQPKVLDLNGLIQENSNMLRRLIGEDVPLVTHFDSDLKHVKADPGQIEQVILNLAVNARDAMPSGGQLILETANVKLTEEYSWRHVSVRPGDYVMLSVTDTGSGMDAETLSHIFEPFFTTKGVGKGTGLGLSTVYGIIQQSGGHIGVHSEPGQGTTFKIYLPIVEEPVEAAESRSWLMETPRGVETVLVVEDEEMVRNLACLTLRMKGYKVLEATDGKEALRACEYDNTPIHLLLSDVVMPRMSGRELARKLIQIRPTMKILYMSGYTDNAVSHHGILDAGLEYLQKPFSPEGLIRRVREVLDSPERGTIV
jgi:PAS domain S-box-containing protein